MILVDTSVWIDFLNSARGPAGGELQRLVSGNGELVLTGLVVAEVLQGLKREVGPVARLLAGWPLIEPDGFASYCASAAISREARSRGIALSTVDSLIAALVLEYDASLFTLDRDFERLAFTGLRLHQRPAAPSA